MPASELARLQKAVKDKCLDCSGGNMHEVEDCPISGGSQSNAIMKGE